jgi:hypothetical protein
VGAATSGATYPALATAKMHEAINYKSLLFFFN